MNAKAAVIQAHFRGYRTRKSLSASKEDQILGRSSSKSETKGMGNPPTAFSPWAVINHHVTIGEV